MADFDLRRVSEMPEVPAPGPDDLIPISKKVGASYLSGHVRYADFAGGLNLQTISEIPSGVINGINDVFGISVAPVSGSLQVFKNGLQQFIDPTGDLIFSGTTLTFAPDAIPLPGDVLRVVYQVVS